MVQPRPSRQCPTTNLAYRAQYNTTIRTKEIGSMKLARVIYQHRLLATCLVLLGIGAGLLMWQSAAGQERSSAASREAVAQANSLSQAFRAAANAVKPTVVKISSQVKP